MYLVFLFCYFIQCGSLNPFISNGMLKYSQKYYSYEWMNYQINYLEIKHENPNKIPILFIHGLGASLYHFRDNIPELAKNSDVYAIDLLGFGRSDKPLINYNSSVWVNQINDFIHAKIDSPCILVGNSIGANLCLEATINNDNIVGTVLINPAGKDDEILSIISDIISGNVILTFLRNILFNIMFTRLNSRETIQDLLLDIYTFNPSKVDNYLISSIYDPLISIPEKEGRLIFEKINSNLADIVLTKEVKGKILLLWGIEDSWIDVSIVNDLQNWYSDLQFVEIAGGHCCHDENSREVNTEIIKFCKNFYLSTEL